MELPAKKVLDTDTLSAMMRSIPSVVSRAQAYLGEAGEVSFSIITLYEILRGLKAKGAERQLKAFRELCTLSEILYLTNDTIETASDIYSDLKRRGELVGDADILIAATALENDAVLVSRNKRHFERIAALRTENWFE
jgi:tRNA(fMet)-specific endonuclease VapC